MSELSRLGSMENRGRKQVMRGMFIIVLVSFVLESTLGIYFIYTDNVKSGPVNYIIYRVIVPLLINSLIYVVVFLAERSSKFSSIVKNRILTYAILLMCTVLAILHSYFFVVWGISAVAVMFCTIFHDKFLLRTSIAASFLSSLLAFGASYLEYPEHWPLAVQNMVVVLVFLFLTAFIANIVFMYNTSMFTLSTDLYKVERRYREGFERDALTGVYSREYLKEEGGYMLSRASVINPVCFALIEMDDLDRINAEHGRENRDEVLIRMGRVLSSLMGPHAVVGRYGRDSFLVIFENGIGEANIDNIEEMKRCIGNESFYFLKEPVTFSGGFYVADRVCTYDYAVGRADDALFLSHEAGSGTVTKA